jgi:transposase
MARPSKYSPELRRRAISEVIERNRSIVEVARDLGIGLPETLRNWVTQVRRNASLEVGPTTEELAELKRLRREVADQQPTIEILRASTNFSPRNSTPDIGECCVHRREPSPLASCGDVRCAQSR